MARLIKGPVRAVLILRSEQQKIHKTNFLRPPEPRGASSRLFITQGRTQSVNEKGGGRQSDKC